MNTVAKHTPGPWEVRIETYDRDIIPGDTHYVSVITRANDTSELGHLLMVNGDYHVCKFNPTKDAAAATKMAADARMIAAAPDLLEHVEMFERSLVYEIKKAELDGDSEGARLKSLTLEMVRQTLAKARGEAND